MPMRTWSKKAGSGGGEGFYQRPWYLTFRTTKANFPPHGPIDDSFLIGEANRLSTLV